MLVSMRTGYQFKKSKKKGTRKYTSVVRLNPEIPSEVMHAESLSSSASYVILTLLFGPDWRYRAAWENPRAALRPTEAVLREPAIQLLEMLQDFVNSSSTVQTLLKQYAISRDRRGGFAESIEQATNPAGSTPAWIIALQRAHARGSLSSYVPRKKVDMNGFRDRIRSGLKKNKDWRPAP